MSLLLLFGGAGQAVTLVGDPNNAAFVLFRDKREYSEYREKRDFVSWQDKRAQVEYRDKRSFVRRQDKRGKTP